MIISDQFKSFGFTLETAQVWLRINLYPPGWVQRVVERSLWGCQWWSSSPIWNDWSGKVGCNEAGSCVEDQGTDGMYPERVLFTAKINAFLQDQTDPLMNITNNDIDVFRTCFGYPRTGYPKFYKLMIDRVEFLTADGAPDEQLALATWLERWWLQFSGKKTCHWQSVFFLHGFTGAWCFLGLSSNETSLGSNERIPWYSVVSKHQSYLPGLVPFCEEAGTGPGHCIRLKFWHWFKVLTLMLSMVQSFDICHQKLCRLLMHFLRSMIPRFDIDHKNSCSHGRIDAEHDSQSHDNSGLGRGLHTPIPSWRKRSLIAYHVAWFFWHWHSKWSSVIWFWLVEFWIDMPSWWNDFLKLEPWLKSH